MCGKNINHQNVRFKTVGSPPRVREKRSLFEYRRPCFGITPACAGKTLFLRWRVVCLPGSPPRVREKLALCECAWFCSRITPACAGKTTVDDDTFVKVGDHPRVCGKNSSEILSSMYRLGSPPRVREKLSYQLLTAFPLGITPACAGKTLKDPNEIKTFLSS